MTQPSLPLESTAPGPIKWSGRLSELLPVLTAEARLAGDGAWKFRHLTHGALVGLQLESDGRRLVRIARAEKPATEHARGRWASELEIFVRHLGIAGWSQTEEADAAGVAVRYLEPPKPAAEPRTANCIDCGTDIPYDKAFVGRDRCQRCAITAGRAGV